MSEWKLAPKDWPATVDCIQSVLNHSPLERLGYRSEKKNVFRTPLEVFTGIIPLRPLIRAVPPADYPKAKSNEEIEVRKLIGIEQLQPALDAMHKEVSSMVSSSRKKGILRHNNKTNVSEANIELGDFVLVRRAQKKGHKLRFVWTGPRRVVKALSRLVFEVESLANKKLETVHSRRLMKYRSQMDGAEVSPQLLAHATHSETTYQDIDEIQDIKSEKNSFVVLVKWQGLPDELDYTWEPIQNMAEDVPDLLAEFLNSPGKQALKNRAKSAAQL